MISPQPIQLAKYLGFKRNKTPSGIKRLFYLSFEDALWDLLEKKYVKNGSLILLPSFYCADVENNIKDHGYKVNYYEIKNDLSVNLSDFNKQIIKIKPQVIIIFHPVGITSNLFLNLEWLGLLRDEIIVIEDSVHKILSPKEMVFFKKNHFIINSLRKVVPLQGSSIYGRNIDLNFNAPTISTSLIYFLKVHLLWLKMTMLWNLGKLKSAEKIMIQGYNIIGDSKNSARGFKLFKLLEEYIDYNKITKIKIKQAAIYEDKLCDINYIKIPKADFGKLRGWPIIVPLEKSEKILNKIRSQNLFLRFELNDSEWSKKQKIIYLPMGPYLEKKDILNICNIIKNAWQT